MSMNSTKVPARWYRFGKWSAVLVVLAVHDAVWAGGDAVVGQLLYEQKCMGCHAVDASRVGPAHRGVFGRRVGSVPGFAYSSALGSSSLVWNAQTLDAWLSEPEKLMPGQAMYFKVSDAKSREDIIAYLATLKQ